MGPGRLQSLLPAACDPVVAARLGSAPIPAPCNHRRRALNGRASLRPLLPATLSSSPAGSASWRAGCSSCKRLPAPSSRNRRLVVLQAQKDPPDAPKGPSGGREWLQTLLSRFGPKTEKAQNTSLLDFEKPQVELDNRIKEVRRLFRRTLLAFLLIPFFLVLITC